MTRDEMLKISFKPYMEINYKHPRMKNFVLCLLVQIDFDDESMTLQPINDDTGDDTGYITKDFIAGIENCSIPRKKMTVVGSKIDIKPLQEYQGSSNRVNPKFNENDML